MVPVPLVFKRADSRNGPPKSGKTPRNLGEFCVPILRVMPGGKKGQDTLPDLSKYLNQVTRLFTKTAQSNGNIIVGYEPPRDYERLKDENGKVLRSMAEKAGPLNKYILARFMQLYCPPTATHGVLAFFFFLISQLHDYQAINGGAMLDLFCGSASMALACHEYGVQYLGMDVEERLIAPARARLASFAMYKQLLGMSSTAPLQLGTEPSGPREQDPFAGLITLTGAAQIPVNNLPSPNLNDFSFAIYGNLEDDATIAPVHALNCQCNVDSGTMIIRESDSACGHLVVKPSLLQVPTLYPTFVYHHTCVGCKQIHWQGIARRKENSRGDNTELIRFRLYHP